MRWWRALSHFAYSTVSPPRRSRTGIPGSAWWNAATQPPHGVEIGLTYFAPNKNSEQMLHLIIAKRLGATRGRPDKDERRAYGSRVCGYKCLRFTISVVSECSCSSSSANYEFVFRCRALHPGRECAVLSEDQTRDKENSQVVQSLDGSGRQ